MTRRSAIITGASYGVGAACARKFAAEGDRLVLADSDEKAVKQLTEEIKEKGGDATYVLADISNRLHVHNIVAEALEAYGRVDVLAHMALRPYAEAFVDTTEEDFERVVAANLRSAFLVNQAAAKQFIKQSESANPNEPGGAIVNLLSTEAVVAAADHVAFAATQGGLLQLTKAIALSLSAWRARANAVAIGSIKSAMLDDEDDQKKVRETAPLKRLGNPEEVAETVYFLLSESASYITGQCIYVDGGRMIRTGSPTRTKTGPE